MSTFFLGQIMLTGFNFAQTGFAQCNGQLLPIAQNQALFSLLATKYGGDGIRTFGLPDLRGRSLYGAGASVDPAWQPPAEPNGVVSGAESVTLTPSNLPIHNHLVTASTAPATTKVSPVNAIYGAASNPVESPYGSPTASPVVLDVATLTSAGGSQPHDNMQPYLVINFNIALTGVFPSRN